MTTFQPLGAAPSSEPPLSPPQEALWLVHQRYPDSPVYNLAVTLRFADGMDPGVASRILRTLARRHPILTTTYRLDDREVPVQREHPDALPPLEHAWSESATETSQIVSAAADQPFRLAAAPPVRAILVAEPGGGCVLSLIAHHIAIDGPSRQILATEIAQLHASGGDDSDLPAPPTPYRDFAVASRSPSGTERQARGLEYWAEQLGGSVAPRLPQYGDANDVPSPGSLSLVLDPGDTARLQRVAFRAGASMHALLATAVTIALWRFTGAEDISLGSVFNGRPRPRFSRTVGHFVNTVVLRCRVDPQQAAHHLLVAMQRVVMQAARHQSTPFSEVVRAVCPTRDAARNPLFDVLFIYDGDTSEDAAATLPSGITLLDESRTASRFDMEIATEVRAARLYASVRYRPAVVSAASAARFTALLHASLTQLGDEVNAPLASLEPTSVPSRREPA